MIKLRNLQWPEDREPILALDTSFITDLIYRIVITGQSAALEEVLITPPLRKLFDLTEDVNSLPDFDHVALAEVDQRIVGMIALKFEAWNRRAVIWHLYVDPSSRGQGIGRALIEEGVQVAQRWQARCLWLETQNINYGAIQFYWHMGFEWCGLDTTLYDPQGPAAGEVALFFTRALP